MDAAFHGHLARPEQLLDAGADPNVASALYYACGRSNNAAIAELLIRAGADPCDGESVYHATDDGHG